MKNKPETNPITSSADERPWAIQAEDKKSDNSEFTVVYSGPSMNHTLCEPDLLTVIPYHERPVKCGDVVYFNPPQGNRRVVHRIVKITAQGIRTRGDNNTREDPYCLHDSDIIGRVITAQRGQRSRRIAGGTSGKMVMIQNRIKRGLLRLSSRLLHHIYHHLSAKTIFSRLLPNRLKPRLIRFQTRHQPILKLMMGERVIGQYDNAKEQWRIRRPFRLFVDVSTLPHPANNGIKLALSKPDVVDNRQ